ncbi:tRNA preQ1(34) S-adenosylmethionine ribosyltransferase-isomerase QueA [Geitlerinema sp. P-1104]|uniref:tRNA preQ1(34) S-adenosylmethionine ribosyltransferase-isomerase QueA n=1 Tax=Geitlerinema sp. P-1104 TaxID=2546230 RepID=UPI00336BE875
MAMIPISKDDLHLDAYDYQLRAEQIAQNPVTPRDHSCLLVVNSPNTHEHQRFWQLPDWLKPGDLLVLNDTRVLPARLYGYKPSGAKVEVLLLEERQEDQWLGLVKPGKRLKPGAEIYFDSSEAGNSRASFRAEVLSLDEATGGRLLQFHCPEGTTVLEMLEQYGEVPFPPYVTESQASSSQYQTVYAREAGSAAAPTAGLHFTPELLQRLQDQGVSQAFVTLHVGVGTFRPVEASDIRNHVMHQEWVEVPQSTVEAVRRTRSQGGRVIAVGTTAVRSLESAGQGQPDGDLAPFSGKTDLFIYPGYRWQVVDGLITNFHLPKSSLMMMVSALLGRKRLLRLYEEAIAHNYRFFSFGDAMLIMPEARLR